MTNKYAGEQSLEINGKDYALVFNWKAIARAQSELGTAVIAKVGTIGALSPVEVAKLLAIGFEAKHPELTAERLIELSPPIVPALLAVDKAIAYAYFGPEGKPDKDEAKAAKADKGSKKKT